MVVGARDAGSLGAEQQPQDAGVDEDGDRGTPAEVLQHERDVPVPLAATISTGGAANEVSVPPIETLTKSTPMVAYLSRSDTAVPKTRSRSISAASVIAAGSVMNEPSSGITDSASR